MDFGKRLRVVVTLESLVDYTSRLQELKLDKSGVDPRRICLEQSNYYKIPKFSLCCYFFFFSFFSIIVSMVALSFC